MDKQKNGLSTLQTAYTQRRLEAKEKEADRERRRTLNLLRVLGIEGGVHDCAWGVRVDKFQITVADDGIEWIWIVIPFDYAGRSRCLGYIQGPRMEWYYRVGLGRKALGQALMQAIDEVPRYRWEGTEFTDAQFPAPENGTAPTPSRSWTLDDA